MVDFADPADHRVKLKESEKKDKYLDLARELKKLWNVNVTFIPIIIGSVTWSTTERRETRNFPYPSVFELTGPKG